MYLRSRHLLQVLQVGVEQVAAGQRNPQNRLDDVADGAVVGQTDLLRCVHEVTATGRTKKEEKEKRCLVSIDIFAIFIFNTDDLSIIQDVFKCICILPGPWAHL